MACALLLLASGCTGITHPEAEGIGQDCASDEQCEGDGQVCHTYAHPECGGGDCRTCEVLCDSDYDCPDDLICNVPPLAPDTVPQICE